MKKITAVLLVLLMLTLCTACGDDDYKVIAGNKEEIQTTQIIEETKAADKILGSWYYVGEDAHFMEFFEDGTAICEYIPDVTYTYTYNGTTLTLTTPTFTRSYDCTITEEGYLQYTWDDAGTPTTETCEKRNTEE